MKKVILLILLSIFATIFCSYFSENPLIDALYFSGENLVKGYFWTPITSLFIHADLMHLVGNIIFLYIFGGSLEREVGSAKTMLAFFLGGALSFILSLYFYDYDVRMVGASAAIFTLASIVMLIKPLKFSWMFLMPLGLVAILYFIYNLFAAYYLAGNIGIGYWGHIIGFLIGVPLGISWSRGRWKINLLITLALLILYLFAASIIMGTFLKIS
ncbi:MAG: rhomboid family intramembrane serine protease [Candidatus Bathyarchaeota archaeon]|nr:rhomboid family intramembrane serine protease [Candidatus Bathyarchaeota archaeon]